MKQNRTILLLLAAFVAMISIPYLVPHTGGLATLAFVPLLYAEYLASVNGTKRFFLWYFAAFVVWNALTTWWVCEATVGGGIFAILYNAAAMSLVFFLFRTSKRHFGGVLPYIFLAVAWIAWERWYLTASQISWPWLVLGNAFARTTTLVQWYEYTGTLGGSLWIWASSILVFALVNAVAAGWWRDLTPKARIALPLAAALVLLGPMAVSKCIYRNYEERSDAGTLDVILAQSNFNPYQKRYSYTQKQQNEQVLNLFGEALKERAQSEEYPDDMLLMMLPETFTQDISMNCVEDSPSWQSFLNLVRNSRNANLLFGAGTDEFYTSKDAAGPLARQYGRDYWYNSYNTAFITDSTGRYDFYHKSKLVIGTELTPYPRIFVPLDNLLGGVMGRCVPSDEPSVLDATEYSADGAVTRKVSLAPVICYESVYGEFCTGYVRKGARCICVITNDGWWGDTPGYRQHFSYSRLRAIELRRDVARCANTGISAFIDQRGDVRGQSGWWVPATLRDRVCLTDSLTFFARQGDWVGRICVFVFALLLLSFAVRVIVRR